MPRLSCKIATALCALVAVIMTVPLAGSLRSFSSTDARTRNRHIQELRHELKLAAGTGSYSRVDVLSREGYQLAIEYGDQVDALRFLNALGSAQLASFRYADALKTYTQARSLAIRVQDPTLFAIVHLNLSNLYAQLGDLDSAALTAEMAVPRIRAGNRGEYRGQLLASLARIRARQNRTAEAVALLRESIAASSLSGDNASLARAWDHLGEALLNSGDRRNAEPALIEAFRIRKLTKDRDLRTSYVKLSRLRKEQGDFASAGRLLEAALELPARDSGVPLWSLYLLKGQILEAEGAVNDATLWYRKALQTARLWRADIVSADALRTSSSSVLHEAYQSYIDATLDSDPLEAFAATETDRASSLLETLSSSEGWRKRAPREYWVTLARLRAAQAAALAPDSAGAREKAALLRERLVELEAEAGAAPGVASAVLTVSPGGNKSAENYSGRDTLADIQKKLRPEEALLSFHLGNRQSALWMITADRYAQRRLPPRNELTALARKFRNAVETSAPDRDAIGHQLYECLLGDLQAGADKTRWLISAGDGLFDVPFAALVSGWKAGRPVYLVESKATSRVPAAGMLTSMRSEDPAGTALIGFGDGVYNVADPRWSRPAGVPKPWLAFAAPAHARFELARLPGTRAEVLACARTWGIRNSEVLLGRDASRANIVAALAKRPALVHFATHVVYPNDQPDQAAIYLGLDPAGQPDLLSSADITALEVPGSIIVMSGCASAGATAPGGAGVLGLARAWLLAGAQAVVGARWPILDNTGALFQNFYAGYRDLAHAGSGSRAAAFALQHSQQAMLRTGSWQADPRYWSAFYIIGRN